MKFWNLFKRTEKEIKGDGDATTAITYLIDDDGEIFIDITVASFEDEDIENLANLVCSIFTEKCQIITTEMIKTNMQKEGEDNKLEKLLSLIIKNQLAIASQELINKEAELRIDSEEPCIKPSDML